MTETNAKIHVLADETLGGIKREYVEVDRKAEVGEKIVIVAQGDNEEGYKNGDVLTVDREYRPEDGDVESDGASSGMNCSGLIYREEYRVLEPTDIVHIDGPNGTAQRYELTDRKAEVGEKVIHVTESGESDGVVTEVTDVGVSMVDVVEYKVSSGEYVCGIYHNLYRVLVPVETEADEPQPVDTIDAIANLATRVADLERKDAAKDELINKALSDVYTRIGRLQDEIDTLHKDNRTLGEELARVTKQVGEKTQSNVDTLAEAFAALKRVGL
ncbi:hypothetical protein [Bacillus velezensis]|uniref:hypothetical protein n=1 Tax=Bacillus velezensis TaxID=492670 RepID=UPI000BA6D41F|nr:hypothetical protein [Bacillus velezensis]PAC78560.1 hypothetical protein CHI11_06635 [Bacillus velezensis]